MRCKTRVLFLSGLIFLIGSIFSGGLYGGANNTVEFSPEEQAYAQEKQTLRVSVVPDWQPFVYYNKKNRQYDGYAIEALERMSRKTGLNLVFLPADTYAQSLEQLKNGECDVLAMQLDDDEAPSSPNLVLYLRSVKTAIFKRGTDPYALPNITIATVEGSENLVPPGHKIITGKTITDCLDEVRSGRSDMVSSNLYISTLLLAQLSARELVAVPSGSSITIGFGLRPQADPRLVALMQKTVRLRSANAISGEMLRYLEQYPKNPLDYLYEYPFEVSSFIISLCFLIVLIGMAYNSIRLRHKQTVNGYEESYRLLSDTFGEAGLEYNCLRDTLTLFGKKKDQFDLDSKIDGFWAKLEEKSLRISLSAEQFSQMLDDGIEGNGFQKDFQLGLKNGEWLWCRLLYTVICTEESHRIPLRVVGCIVNIEQEQAEKEYLLELGLYDQLTGLLNRNAAKRKINALISPDNGANRGVLLILDIDNFKKMNDTYGHLCGDDVLRFLGTVLKESFDSRDILSRWGGDEFLLFLVKMAEYSDLLRERMEILYKKMAAYTYNGKPCPVTLSAGGIIQEPAGQSLEELFKKADDALYTVKKQGRNNFLILTDKSLVQRAAHEQ